jgi:outer membrane receptor protein involved in Fe transport
VTLWQVDFSDFIELDPDTDVVTNHGGFRNRGVDLVVEADLARLGARGFSAWANVTWQRAEFTTGPNDGNDVQFVPEWKAAAGVKWTHASGAFAGLHGYYFGKCPVDAANVHETGDYAIAGARAGWRRCFDLGCADVEIEAAATVKNLFDNDYFLRHDATLYVPGAPRELFFELAIGIQF